jgi:UPF0716 protein FxsA
VRWLLLFFVVLPIADLILLVWLGARWGLGPTVSFALVDIVLGTVIARREGLRVVRSFRTAFEQRQPPERGIIDGLLVFVAAALLIVPGLLSDVLALALLVPFTRRRIAARVRAGLDRRLETAQFRVVQADFSGFPEHAPERELDVINTSGESLDDSSEAPPLPRLPKPKQG